MSDVDSQLSNRTFHREYYSVLEKYRRADDGNIYIHHHIHILIRTDVPKSKIIQYCMEVMSKHIGKQRNFIDVKQPKDKIGSFEDKLRYIRGQKTAKKMECVELDKKWREG